ncbi:winged helix-turn-helix domain-containing protein [Streptomyces sp. NPDC021622]|uniref:helix-turn-helix domain-containing protein n=1 Tax=Streptomyces sp. NPDC021622 TaxID=3155013 RepID=UPI0033E66FD1
MDHKISADARGSRPVPLNAPGSCHKSYTVQGVRKLLMRHGFSCQIPARRAVERDDEAIASWVKETCRRSPAPGPAAVTPPP